jgi:hypothetical protein
VEVQKGHESIGAEIGKLVDKKQAAYGNSFGESGKVLEILYPAGVRPYQYTELLAVTRVLDKIFRIATDPDAFGEDAWKDLAGYSILMTAHRRQRGKNNGRDDSKVKVAAKTGLRGR